jgi:hypothetical protein
LLAVATISFAQQAAALKPPVATPEVKPVTVPEVTPVTPFPLYYPAVEFDRPYTGTLIFTVADETTEVQKACNGPGPALGCSLLYANRCLVVLAPDNVIKAHDWTTEAVKRHEIAHCNGWPSDHRGWRLYDR